MLVEIRSHPESMLSLNGPSLAWYFLHPEELEIALGFSIQQIHVARMAMVTLTLEPRIESVKAAGRVSATVENLTKLERTAIPLEMY